MRYILLPTVAALLIVPSAAANSEGNYEWPELDRELEALNESMMAETTGPRLWGYVRTNFAWSDELRNAAGDSFAGVSMDNVRLAVDGKIDNYSYRVSADMASGPLNLLDAYLRWGDRNGVQRELKAIEELWPVARTNLVGETWTAAWADWEKRLQQAKGRVEKRPSALVAPRQQE